MIAAEHISEFGEFNGEKVHCISLKNKVDTVLRVLTWGATWHALELNDKNGTRRDVIVGPKNFKGYQQQTKKQAYFFGNTIGRYAGRIAERKEIRNGNLASLEFENGVHLHGGLNGLHNKIWEIVELNSGEEPSVILGFESANLEEGYPGNLSIKVNFSLSAQNRVSISYTATSDSDTVLNLTNHAYFNLGDNSVEHHACQITAKKILETDEKLIPTGNFILTAGTAYDFYKSKELSQIKQLGGLDTCFVLDQVSSQLKLFSKASGIKLEIETNQPAAVIFAPKHIAFASEPKNHLWSEIEYPAICFETQNFPDAPNHPNFPSSILKKGETYRHETSFNFNLIQK
ncbi:aldose epimerase family protein [Croceivirga thetidis]|uniref:Aldose 1-epimerase n=1 Tax=Croceivirga thetidis TaxID=2721623 RepID=A0ABX1GMG0_9FLAO|nr:aldose epimerase family protein [Croceivirga thetidis]NKI30754.1 galactose mutarotase [Croceivirga thetidis]